jgi:hypothetical protein
MLIETLHRSMPKTKNTSKSLRTPHSHVLENIKDNEEIHGNIRWRIIQWRATKSLLGALLKGLGYLEPEPSLPYTPHDT